ncbi:hypothetical protein OROGR_023135 [Orobanche gracilis]
MSSEMRTHSRDGTRCAPDAEAVLFKKSGTIETTTGGRGLWKPSRVSSDSKCRMEATSEDVRPSGSRLGRQLVELVPFFQRHHAGQDARQCQAPRVPQRNSRIQAVGWGGYFVGPGSKSFSNKS